jgi:hypothetical protein
MCLASVGQEQFGSGLIACNCRANERPIPAPRCKASLLAAHATALLLTNYGFVGLGERGAEVCLQHCAIWSSGARGWDVRKGWRAVARAEGCARKGDMNAGQTESVGHLSVQLWGQALASSALLAFDAPNSLCTPCRSDAVPCSDPPQGILRAMHGAKSAAAVALLRCVERVPKGL